MLYSLDFTMSPKYHHSYYVAWFLNKNIILLIKSLYLVFGPGSIHGAHAQFMALAKKSNHGRSLNILQSVDTRIAVFLCLTLGSLCADSTQSYCCYSEMPHLAYDANNEACRGGCQVCQLVEDFLYVHTYCLSPIENMLIVGFK
jgi:hypothetical protein